MAPKIGRMIAQIGGRIKKFGGMMKKREAKKIGRWEKEGS
jgi:hypothetical protein